MAGERARFDPLTGVEVTGWVVVPGRSGPKLSLYIDGRAVAEGVADLPRPEGVSLGVADGRCGFRFILPGAVCDGGVHQFTLRVEDIARPLPASPHIAKIPDRGGQCVTELTPAAPATSVQKPPANLPIVPLSDTIRMNVEVLEPERCVGWMINPSDPDTTARADVYIDGVRWQTLTADYDRGDLVALGMTRRGGGFRFIPPAGEDVNTEVAVRFAPVGTTDFVATTPAKLRLRALEGTQLSRVLGQLITSRAGVAVIVPVSSAAENLRKCLDSLIRHRSWPYRVIVIDDCSPDESVKPILAEYEGAEGFEVHYQPVNRGYTGTINHGIELAGRDDVIFLNSDTIVTPGWMEGLRCCVHSDPRIATVTAVSDNAGAFSVPEIGAPNLLPEGWTYDDMARLVRQSGKGAYPRVPTGNGFCLYVRRAAIDALGVLDLAAFPKGYGEENDFCMRAVTAGWLNLIDDRTFVHHTRSSSFGAAKTELLAAGRKVVDERYPEYGRLVKVFTESEPLLTLRWRVRKALVEAGGRPPVPRIAFVIATRTGGTPQTNQDLMDALGRRAEPYVIACDSSVIEVMRYDGEGRYRTLERVALSDAIRPSQHRSADYNDAVAAALIRHGIELVHVRHLAWHGLDLPAVAKAIGIKVVLSFHDFYAVCPTVKLLDNDNIYCGGACTASEGECRVELWPQGEFPPLKNRFVHNWRHNFSRTFAHCDAFVTTSSQARDVYIKAFPELADADFRLITHGRSFEPSIWRPQPPLSHEPLKVLVPGNISPAKGSDLINAIIDLDHDKRIEFHILGDPGKVYRDRHAVIHGGYKRHEFADKVAAIGPHIGAVLSIWPETYCHTLSEMWACGLPVVGMEVGAVGERITQTGAGWLLPLGTSPQDAFQAMQAIASDISDWRTRSARVRDWQEGEGRLRTTAAMAEDYCALYQSLLGPIALSRHPERQRVQA